MDAIPSHPLVVSDRPFLHPRLRALSSLLAEYSFANLYLFRTIHRYRLVEGEGFPIVGYSRKGNPFLLPTSLQPEDIFATKQLAKQYRLPLFPISEEWLTLFSPFADKTTDPGDNDYLFSHQTLSTYPGRKLDKKRNLVTQFLRNTKITLLPLEENTRSYALEVLQNWQSYAREPPHLSDFFPMPRGTLSTQYPGIERVDCLCRGKTSWFFPRRMEYTHLFYHSLLQRRCCL